MNYNSLVANVVAILNCLGCLAQSTPTAVTEDFSPASTNQEGKLYPQVNSERRVRASFTAPDAQKIQLDIGGKKYDLFYQSPGTGHEWLTWRRDLHQFASLLFKK